MANWKLYLRDYAREGTRTGVNISNMENAVNGFDSMLAVTTASPASITWDFGAGNTRTVRALGLANHNMTGNGLQAQYSDNGSSWTTFINTGSLPSGDYILDDGGAAETHRYFKAIWTGTAGLKFGGISLLSGATGHTIELTECWPIFPIEGHLASEITQQMTAAGNIIEQRLGGSSRVFSLEIPSLQQGLAANEGLLDDAFLDESYDALGFLGPIWVIDDAGVEYHAQVQRPIQWTLDRSGNRVRAVLTLRTIPHVGFYV